jgi:hypothetical protein
MQIRDEEEYAMCRRFYSAIVQAALESPEMIERVAKALYEAGRRSIDGPVVMAAMREMNEDMIAAGLKTELAIDRGWDREALVQIWGRMIDVGMRDPEMLNRFRVH